MRNLQVLMCTILFVLLSACQDQSGLVQDVRPTEAIASFPVQTDAPIESSIDVESQLVNVYSEILSIIFLDVAGLTDDQLAALAADPAAAEAYFHAISTTANLPELLDLFEEYFHALVDLEGIDYTQNVLIQTAADVVGDIIKVDEGSPDLYVGECFDRLQVDQATAWSAFGTCVAASWETGIGPLLCWVGLTTATVINFKRFKDCVKR